MDENSKRYAHSIVKIGVAGATNIGHCGADALDIGQELGREIVRHGAMVLTGATTGFPLWVAQGVKDEGGMNIGFSPAATQKEHSEVYRLPVGFMDVIVYTGFGYVGRDLLFTRSSDALILGCGQIGTIHAFSIAFQDKKPIGVLEGPWKVDDTVRSLLETDKEASKMVVFDKDPKRLLEKVLELVKEYKANIEK